MSLRTICISTVVILQVFTLAAYAVQDADFNLDCIVNLRDFAALAEVWLVEISDAGWDDKFDIDNSNVIDANDVGLFAIYWLTRYAEGAVIYVDANAAPGGDGGSWENAFIYLQDAIAAANCGYQIYVAQGVYKPDCNSAEPDGTGDRTATFQLKNGVAVRGGFKGGGGSGNERDIANYKTVLSGDLYSYHVVTADDTDETAILEGFTIKSGNANGSSSNSFGGGMFITKASPKVTSCIFTKNRAMSGTGVYIYRSSTRFSNCVFYENGQHLEEYGGGVLAVHSSPVFTNCVFTQNAASYGGGAIAFKDCNSSPFPRIVNCTFSKNHAWGEPGSGIYNIASNPIITNCILWDLYNEIFNDSNSNPAVNYCNIKGGYPGLTNIDSCPLFIDDDNPDGNDGIFYTADDGLRLDKGSPCSDTADDNFAPEFDILDNGRIDNKDGLGTTLADMGAYEGQFTYIYEQPQGLFAGGTIDLFAGYDYGIYKYIGGTSWEPIVSSESPENDYFLATSGAVFSLCEYDGQLYAGTQHYSEGAQAGVEGRVWRYDGEDDGEYFWTRVGTGMGEQVTSLVVFEGDLYAACYEVGEPVPLVGKLYKYEGGTTWTKVADTSPPRDNNGFLSTAVFNNKIFLGDFDEIYSYTPAPGPGLEKVLDVGSIFRDLEVYNNELYAVSTVSCSDPDYDRCILLAKTSDGNNWIPDTFTSPTRTPSIEIEQFNGDLFIGYEAEVFRENGYGYWYEYYHRVDKVGVGNIWEVQRLTDSDANHLLIISMTTTVDDDVLGDSLIFATGNEHRLAYYNDGYEHSHIDEHSIIYRYNGTVTEEISEVDGVVENPQTLIYCK